MLLGEKLFWHVRRRDFSTQFSLGQTPQTRNWQRRKPVARPQKKTSAGNQRWPNPFPKLRVHSPLGSFSSSCLGGAFSFGGFALGAPSLGAFSLVVG